MIENDLMLSVLKGTSGADVDGTHRWKNNKIIDHVLDSTTPGDSD